MGLAHVVLHLTLCRAAAGVPAGTAVPISLHLEDITGRKKIDQTFSVGTSGTQIIAFDVPGDLYRATLKAPSLNCGDTDYWPFVADHTRTMDVALSTNGDQSGHPMIFLGTAPKEFVDLNPTFALIDKGTPCGAPLEGELSAKIRVEDDGSTFFAWLYPNPQLRSDATILTLKVTLPNGRTHYVPLNVAFPQPWEGFPASYNIEVMSDAIPILREQASDALACTRVFQTRGTIYTKENPTPDPSPGIQR